MDISSTYKIGGRLTFRKKICALSHRDQSSPRQPEPIDELTLFLSADLDLAAPSKRTANGERAYKTTVACTQNCYRCVDSSGTTMGIKRQEFYEGAALHLVARTTGLTSLRYEAPFFILNGSLSVLLKYSTKNRSPWAFTFSPDEQLLLKKKAAKLTTAIGLVCGADGVAGVAYELFRTIAPPTASSIHIACYRHHGEHYDVCGPEGSLGRKIAPSLWSRILEH